MARKRKSAYDPNQLSLFDVVADSIEQKQEEKVRENIIDEPEPSVRLELVNEQEKQEEDTEPVRLGINSDGASVYRMPDGSRMASHNLAIMRLVDGDKFSPEELYVQNRHEFLTIKEVSLFRNNTNLEVEAQNVRQANRPSGNRKNHSKTGNNSGREKWGLQQPSLFNSGSLGVEQPGRTDEAGSPGENTIRSETYLIMSCGAAMSFELPLQHRSSAAHVRRSDCPRASPAVMYNDGLPALNFRRLATTKLPFCSAGRYYRPRWGMTYATP